MSEIRGSCLITTYSDYRFLSFSFPPVGQNSLLHVVVVFSAALISCTLSPAATLHQLVTGSDNACTKRSNGQKAELDVPSPPSNIEVPEMT